MKTICRGMGMALIMIALVACTMEVRAQGAEKALPKIESVILYQGQALVTRVVDVDGPAGAREIVVGDLPPAVLPDSLFAEGDEGIEIRAVRYRTRAVGEEPREELRKLEKEQQDVQWKLEKNTKLKEVLGQRKAYLEKMESFVAPTAKVELSKGVLNAETLEKLTTFSFAQREKIVEQEMELATELVDLKKQLTLLMRKRTEIASGAGKAVREALLFLDKKAAGAGKVKLNYLVGGCGWSPAYNFYAESGGKEIRLEYNAQIRQQTGEDWSGVKLTISTAFPALSSEAPGLAPFRLSLAPMQPQQRGQKADLGARIMRNQKKLQDATTSQYQAIQMEQNRRFNWTMNEAASDNQYLELTNPQDVLGRLDVVVSRPQEGLAVSYALGNPVALASRPDQQLVRIFEAGLPAKFFHVSAPMLTSLVYRQAEITHKGAEALLGGRCSVYLDGKFVGRGEIPSVSRGETFVVGFGADSQLRASRELVDRKETHQGGNQRLSFKYRLTLENFKEKPTVIRVMDRLPIAEDEKDIKVTLDELKDKLSEDSVYVRTERPKGILRWDIEVPAGASGETARHVEFGYQVEFDRKLSLTVPVRAQQMMQEFMELQGQRGRFKRK